MLVKIEEIQEKGLELNEPVSVDLLTEALVPSEGFKVVEAGKIALRFKKVGRYWSARVGLDYRAVAVEVPDGFLWIWIGPHDDYERLIGR